MTQIGIAPVGVGKGVVSGVGAGVGAVGKGVKNIFKKEGTKVVMEDHSVTEVPAASVEQPIPVPAGPNGAASGSGSPPAPSSSSVTLPGILRVDVIDGHDLMASDGDQVKPYVIASIGETEHKTKHVSKTNAPTWWVTIWLPRCNRTQLVWWFTGTNRLRSMGSDQRHEYYILRCSITRH